MLHMVHVLFTIHAETAISPGALPHASAGKNALDGVLEIVFGIAGALALLMITISGLRYITSAGDPQKASNARNGVIYALVGLVLAIAAEAIVVFAVNNI